MKNTVLVGAESSAADLAGGDTTTAFQHIAKSNFSHVSNGNYKDTLKAIEAYLVSKEERRHGYGAELIMFMERSFSGKYRNGEWSHYQRIMPGGKWPNKDTLSEKLTRCKDKETFKRRFDLIGTTAILKREHFDNREITNLDFKGRMYLRLIDTTNNNLSYFYRNDALVDAFIRSALAFYREQTKAKKNKTRGALKGKPEVVGTGKPEVVFLENPKPLLYTEVDSRRLSGKSKSNSLKLVHSSPTGKAKNQPGKEEEVEKTSDLGFSMMSDAEFCKPVPVSKEGAGNAVKKPHSGLDVFLAWRGSILAEHPEKCISESPTNKQTGQAADFYTRFSEFFPTHSVADFFAYLTRNWETACKKFKDEGIWQKFGSYPEIPNLLAHSNHVLTWYKNEKGVPNGSAQTKKPSSPAHMKKEADKVPEVIPLAPYKGCVRTTEKGRTFCVKPGRGSLEYQIAEARMIEEWLAEFGQHDHSLEFRIRLDLEKYSLDMVASEARIEELSKMDCEEFDLYDC